MARTHRKRAPLSVEDVLSGRVRAGVAELLDLIHQVNPTGRDLPPSLAEQRYTLKSRLQSHLLRHHGAEIIIRPDPQGPGFVSLSCPQSGRDACHALLENLDEDVRSLVQQRLDLGDPDEAPAPVRPPPSGPVQGPPAGSSAGAEVAALLQRGQALQEAYDYEAARACFEEALGCASDDPGPAQKLLELLVDHLGADDEALGLLPALSTDALHSVPVRLLLSRAAARRGDEALAMRLIEQPRPLHHPEVGAIHLLFGQGALSRGDLGAAQMHLDSALGVSPPSPESLRLREEIGRRRSMERQPHEAEVLRLLEAGALREAEEQARLLQQRFPDSPVAGRVLRLLDERHRTAAAEALVAEAEAAYQGGARPTARSLLGEALRTAVAGEQRERIQARLRELEEEQRIETRARAVAQVVDLLLGQDPRDLGAGLSAFLELPGQLREQVLAAAPPGRERYLRWAEQIDRHRPGSPLRAVVEATLALGQAEDLLPQDPQAALLRIASHERYLERLPEAHKVRVTGEDGLRARQQEEALRRYAEVVAGEPSYEALLRLREELDLRLLPEAERRELSALWAEAQKEQELRADWGRLGRLANTDCLAALDGYHELLKRAPADRRELVGGAIRIAQRAADAHYVLHLDHEPGGVDVAHRARCTSAIADELVDFDPLHPLDANARQWLLPDEDAVVLARSVGTMLFLRVLCLKSHRVKTRMVLRTGQGFLLARVVVEPGSIWLFDRLGWAMQILLPGYHVRRLIRLTEDDTQRVEQPIVTPDPAYLWAPCHPRHGEKAAPQASLVRVVSLRNPRRPRRIGHQVVIGGLFGLSRPLIVGAREADRLLLHEPSGSVVAETRFDPLNGFFEALAHPSEDSALLLSVRLSRPPPDAALLAGPDGGLRLFRLSLDGALRGPWPVRGAHDHGGFLSAVSRAEGLCFLLQRLLSRGPEGVLQQGRWDRVLCLELGPGEPSPPPGHEVVPRYRVPAPRGTILAQDCRAGRTVAISMSGRGLRVVRLTRERPTLRFCAHQPAPVDRDLSRIGPCFTDSAEESRRVRAFFEGLLAEANRKPDEMVDLLQKAMPPDLLSGETRLEHMNQVGLVFQMLTDKRVSGKLMARMGLQGPWLMLFTAHRMAAMGQWECIAGQMGQVQAELLSPAERCHAHHLRAFSCLWLGDCDEALREVARGRKLGGPCDFSVPLGLARPLGGGPQPGEPVPRQLFRLLAGADEHLARGEDEAAERLLNCRLVWAAREVQCLARLASIWLRRPAPSGPERFRKHLMLLSFAAANPEEGQHRQEVPYPRGRWDRQRLDALGKEAVAWVDEAWSKKRLALAARLEGAARARSD